MIKNMRLETDNLIIRTYNKDDSSSLSEILRDKEVLKYIPEKPKTIEEAKVIVDWLISNYNLDKEFKYAFPIELKENNEFIGWCGFGYLDHDKSEYEIYYTLKRKYWGKGLATEASRALIDYIFTKTPITKLVAVVKPNHIASQKVIEKLGFSYRGIVENVAEDCKFYEGDLYYTLAK